MGFSLSPVLGHWPAGQFDQLTHHFSDLASVSRVDEVNSVTDIQISRKGTVVCRDGREYRFTTQALQQVCRLLSPGLFQLINSVTGQVYEENEPTRAFSDVIAADVYNKILSLRYDIKMSSGTQVLCNDRDRLIEGVYSVTYTQLSNSDVLELAMATALDYSPNMVFQDAWKYGRRLIVRFVSPEPVFDIRVNGADDTWYRGLHFENSEIGDASFRTYPILWHAKTGTYSSDWRNSSARHTGRDLLKRVRVTIARAMARYDELPRYGNKLVELVSYKVPLTTTHLWGNYPARAFLDKFTRDSSWLRNALSKIIVNALLFKSSPPQQELVGLGTGSRVEPCSGYDLLMQILYATQTSHLHSKLELERIARLLPIKVLFNEKVNPNDNTGAEEDSSR